MFTNSAPGLDQGHAHGVDLEATFDFLNTRDTDNGFPVEKLASLDDALAWFVDRGVIHSEGAVRAQAKVAEQAVAGDKDLDRVHSVRDALREVAEAIAAKRAPRVAALQTVNRALHARQVIELVPAPELELEQRQVLAGHHHVFVRQRPTGEQKSDPVEVS